MSRIAFIIVALALAACAGDIRRVDPKVSMQMDTTNAAFDTNSSLGEIVISDEIKISLDSQDSVNQLGNVIKKRQSETSLKQFFFIDLVTSKNSSSSDFIRLITDSLRPMSANYEINVVQPTEPLPDGKAFLKLRSIKIKPRDCSPNSSPPLETVGGYYEAKFGCAFANNIGAMLDSPRDALKPRTTGVVDAQRTMRILRAYIDGTATSAAIPTNEAGEASAVTP
jgi:type IV pilus biogenesis protein CpaD/CtpE